MTNNRKKVSVIGSGFTGATTAFLLAQKELCDVVLVDIPQMENPTKGKALDMLEAAPVQGFDVNIIGTSDYADTKNSDIVIITAGIARKPGMSRDDLVQTNQKVMKIVTAEIVKHSPNTKIIVLTNPVDAMTYTVYKESGLPKEHVIGQSGVLDTARFRTFVAQELNLSIKDVTGFVLGGHGDDMVPLVRYSSAGGIPLETLISPERLEEIIDRTRKFVDVCPILWNRKHDSEQAHQSIGRNCGYCRSPKYKIIGPINWVKTKNEYRTWFLNRSSSTFFG